MQGLRSLWSPLLMTLVLLCDNKRTSAVCQQKFRTALMLNYLYGLSSFKIEKFRKKSQVHSKLRTFRGRLLWPFVLIYRVRESPFSTVVNRFELRYRLKQLFLFYCEICPCLLCMYAKLSKFREDARQQNHTIR